MDWEGMILARQEAEETDYNGEFLDEGEEEVVEIYNPNLFPNRKENFR